MSYDPAADFAECDRVFPKPGPIAVPRVARSLDDLRVGQWVVYRDQDYWDAVRLDPGDEDASQWTPEQFKGGNVVILSDPPPEPVQVSRAAFDRLADLVARADDEDETLTWAHWLRAARALINEVNKP